MQTGLQNKDRTHWCFYNNFYKIWERKTSTFYYGDNINYSLSVHIMLKSNINEFNGFSQVSARNRFSFLSLLVLSPSCFYISSVSELVYLVILLNIHFWMHYKNPHIHISFRRSTFIPPIRSDNFIVVFFFALPHIIIIIIIHSEWILKWNKLIAHIIDQRTVILLL